MLTKNIPYAHSSATAQSMRGTTAELTVTATGDIAKVVTHVLMLPIFDGGTKRSQLQADLTFTIKNYFWKTDHKKIWFMTTEVVSVDRVIGQGDDVSDLGELNPNSINAIVRMLEDSCTLPVEIKDWWLSSVRSEISNRVRSFIHNNINSIKTDVRIADINCGTYFMTEESYMALKYAGNNECGGTEYVDEGYQPTPGREQLRARYPKGTIIPLDESHEPANYRLIDLPIGPIRMLPPDAPKC